MRAETNALFARTATLEDVGADAAEDVVLREQVTRRGGHCG
jgi:hypothetical protein